MAQQQITLANYSDLEGVMYATDTDQPTGEVEFTSYDTTLDPTTTESVALLTSSDTWGSRFQKVSQMFKNIRYLLKMLGTTNISSIGNGTVTGALSTLNSNISSLIYVEDYTVPELTLTSGTPGTRGAQVSLDVAVSGYLPLLVRLTQVSDSSLANVVPFFGSPSTPNTVYVNAYRASGNSGTITANVRVVYRKN